MNPEWAKERDELNKRMANFLKACDEHQKHGMFPQFPLNYETDRRTVWDIYLIEYRVTVYKNVLKGFEIYCN